jgi:hypothetical protein
LLGQTNFFWDIGFPLDGDQVLQELGVRQHLLDGIQERDVDLHLFEHFQNVLELSSFLGHCIKRQQIRPVHEERRRLWFGFSGLKHEDPGHKVGFRVINRVGFKTHNPTRHPVG